MKSKRSTTSLLVACLFLFVLAPLTSDAGPSGGSWPIRWDQVTAHTIVPTTVSALHVAKAIFPASRNRNVCVNAN